ncbi:MAG: PKD domain-containing protein, partial [Sphingobacteriales bacterium]
YIQVFSPVSATGTIDLNLSAVKHADTCAPLKNCLSTAVFLPQFDCTKSEAVTFTNLSTYGSNIQYQWDFGYGSLTSSDVSPAVVYPSLATSQTYTIKLKVLNGGCQAGTQNVDSTTAQITIPGRPSVNLGSDTTLCNFGSNLVLNATTWPGTTYQWSTGQTTPTITVSTASANAYNVWVKATYNGCVKLDTINMAINPINKLKQTRYLCGGDSVLLNSQRNQGEVYLWNTGAITPSIWVKDSGQYIDQLSWRTCTVRDSFDVIKAVAPFQREDTTQCPPFRNFTLNATSSGAQSYQWQNNSTNPVLTVTAPGQYWVRVNYPNCTLRDTFQVKLSPPALTSTKDTTVCAGTIYPAPWGQLLTTTGTYRDTVRYATGCDSLIRTVKLNVITPQTKTTNASICGGGSYTLPWGVVTTSSGTYSDTLRSTLGCDSVYRVVNVAVNIAVVDTTRAVLCSGQSYTLPWGQIVNASGVYRDTLKHTAGCDSVIRIIDLSLRQTFSEKNLVTVCEGSAYTLPWGGSVNQPGIYRDTVRYVGGCDSLRREITVQVQNKQTLTTAASICSGQTYSLPWGGIVSSSGTYRDTLRYQSGCDSVVRVVNLLVNPALSITSSATVCQGQSVTLPWGGQVSATGIYRDTVRYASGCDSLIRSFQLTVKTPTVQNVPVSLCGGQSYTLPWGVTVNSPGIYQDTLRDGSSCDSLIRVVDVKVNAPQALQLSASICAGQSYTLPSGQVVSMPGVYKDTLHYQNGCDSLVRSVNVTVRTMRVQALQPVICAGGQYTLPWGQAVSTSGVYQDTLRYTAGCDSIVRIVQLTVKTATTNRTAVSLCGGESYPLPWGTNVNASGLYKDTLRDSYGCDSLIREYDVKVNAAQSLSLTAAICAGDAYTLPWGQQVAAAGLYRDTLRYQNGCDSVLRTVQLSVRAVQQQAIQASICQGSAYTLPWGAMTSNSGIYRDTLRYAAGCDSVVRTVSVTVKTFTVQSSKAVICSGQAYTLPWGATANISGIYRDTLRYRSGCDSVQRSVDVTVQDLRVDSKADTICAGSFYTLPWGTSVSSPGIYRDTLRFASGCDSVRRTVQLYVQGKAEQTQNAVICEGSSYTLPWGVVASSQGLYSDTLRSQKGCDSLIRKVTLTVKAITREANTITICSGRNYTLPWGGVVTSPGIYRDTIRYQNGCDSLVRSIDLRVTAPAANVSNVSICSNERYTLPWGGIVSNAGIYRDTIRTQNGCDSLIRTVNLAVRPAPQVSITKSNDVDCMQGTSTLTATGGDTYSWSPAFTVDRPLNSKAIVTPLETTMYVVTAGSANGCSTKDSVEVKVTKGVPENGYLVPSA